MSKTPGTLASENFDRIWLEPREGADPYIGRQWCQDNQWGDDGIEYVRADLAALQSAAEAPPPSSHTLRLAVAAVLEADTEFRSNMIPGWEGDPLSDEIDGLRRIFEADPAPQTNAAPVPALWAECAYCKEAGEEECLHPVDELRWNGAQWCCEECGAGEEPDLWQASPRIAIPSPQPNVPCPCTLIEQDEECPVGYPSMICGVCKGIGNTTPEQVTALACEMIKIASDIGEPDDPFAAWESIDLIKSQHGQLRKEFGRIADMLDAEDADLDDAISIASAALAATATEDCPTCSGTGKEGRHSICRDCDEPPSPAPRTMGTTDLEEVAASIGFVLDNKRWEDCSEGFKETCRECAAVADRLIREDRL